MHLGALTTKRFVIAAAATALTFFLLGMLASQATAGTGGIGAGGASATTRGESTERVGTKYERIWDRLSRKDKRWARSTSECESGGDPNAIGSGGLYRGAFQFMRSTWKASPKSPGGDPIAYPYRTQAVVAILLKNRDGAQHWPVCG
jgi:Transglycosylase-like domain